MGKSQQQELLDIFIVGGGINGAGIANDAVGRGLKVGLCEQADLASATSSASSKLIHGGLRYLEHHEFRLVREALREREVLLKKAPHIVWPLRFILPHRPHLRPAWMIRAGLFLYDHLGKRDSLAGSRRLRFDATSALKPEITQGFEYSDCWVDDARLVVLNALQARQQGAEIRVRTRCTEAREEGGHWLLTLEDSDTGQQYQRRAKVLVNAAGPWVESFIRRETGRLARYGIRMIQGSHIVVPRLNTDDRAYILQNHDGRIVFVLPYQQDFSLIGTTDRRYTGDPDKVTASDEEADYLLEVVNAHFKQQLGRDDIVSTFSGVRPLCDDESSDPSAMTRDYTLDLDSEGSPLLSVFGGKITTYRKLAEAALAMLGDTLPEMGAPWTAEHPLPGGDIGNQHEFAARLVRDYPFLGEGRARRFAASYGSLCLNFLRGCRTLEDLGEDFGACLSSAEVDYLTDHEWARDADDVLWRRTKLGLRLDMNQRQRLAGHIATHRQGMAA
ncbi:glycerol-3-phosphate dehydrogenase [Litchfieldella qijiaojingensis]|uniref:Glycerol-3-phosphate dehydrogenase n=1 Tax=Litchfieldella qijiaojingensis TaxID=980347 RepID=A0ABQ2Y9X7_9GAMM|nr:glycerol-3-phosphate dehydrogenase [Halomonas qijiaojingensis]GGX77492.1 glycerol-3-phosphate dehydrogenase [Halomonas qijiaojingensis]